MCVKCQSLFSGRNKKNIINLSSAKFDHRVVLVKHVEMTMTHYLFKALNYIREQALIRMNIVVME